MIDFAVVNAGVNDQLNTFRRRASELTGLSEEQISTDGFGSAENAQKVADWATASGLGVNMADKAFEFDQGSFQAQLDRFSWDRTEGATRHNEAVIQSIADNNTEDEVGLLTGLADAGYAIDGESTARIDKALGASIGYIQSIYDAKADSLNRTAISPASVARNDYLGTTAFNYTPKEVFSATKSIAINKNFSVLDASELVALNSTQFAADKQISIDRIAREALIGKT